MIACKYHALSPDLQNRAADWQYSHLGRELQQAAPLACWNCNRGSDSLFFGAALLYTAGSLQLTAWKAGSRAHLNLTDSAGNDAF